MRRVVLVGLSGAGKSAVGDELAGLLGWELVDVDAQVEAEDGRTIAEIFAQDGEAAFRALEAACAARALRRDAVVIATGGGWPTNPAAGWPWLPPGSLSVWLRVGANEAVRRAGPRGLAVRPLLAGADAVEAAKALLAARRGFYAMARVELDTERSEPREIARRIAELARDGGTEAERGPGGTNRD